MVRFCSCRPLFCDQKTAEQRTPILSLRLLWQLSYIYHAGFWHIFAARVDVVTPVGRAHATIKGKPNLHINRFFTCTVQSNSTRSGRDIYRSLILTRHHGNILALVGTLDNCRIYRRLNRGMRYTLSARRADNKSGCAGRVIGEGFHAAALVSGMQNSVEHRNSALLLPTESGEKRYRRGLIRRTLIGGLSYRRSASRQKPMPAPDGKLKMCSQVAPGYEIEK